MHEPPRLLSRWCRGACGGVAAFAAAFGGWIRRAATATERIGAGIVGVLLIAPSVGGDVAGGIVAVIVVLAHLARVKKELVRLTACQLEGWTGNAPSEENVS